MKTSLYILFFLTIASTFCSGQINYNQPCITADLTIGNGIYGTGSLKIGSEFPVLNHQKIGVRLGAGLDIGKKIGFGIVASPYQFKKWDFLVACDLTRIFGRTYTYHSDRGENPNNSYSFANTNLIIPSLAVRFPGAAFFTMHVTFGWAFGLNSSPNIVLVSGPGASENLGDVENSVIGGPRFEFGGTFRIRKWKNNVGD